MNTDNSPMLNAYPDSLGGNLEQAVRLLQHPAFQQAFGAFYILPSLFNSDLDRGFSIIDYSLNQQLASPEALNKLKELRVTLKLDLVLNHVSVLSRQFQDVLENGTRARYYDFFIDWNKFWQGCGEPDRRGVTVPGPAYIKDMFFRKPGLPVLSVLCGTGETLHFWNTFYQEKKYPRPTAHTLMRSFGLQYSSAELLSRIVCSGLDAGLCPDELELGQFSELRQELAAFLERGCSLLGQVDVNTGSSLVWEYYRDSLRALADYGAGLVRLDAFAYAPKAVGRRNFLNEPETWELLAEIRKLADEQHLELLPEIHGSYAEGCYMAIAEQGYLTYDFFLPGLILDAIEHRNADTLAGWANELIAKRIRTVNMLGCHDGIPLLDLKGLLPDQRIQALINTVVSRGGRVKNLHGQTKMYYQVNATYFSALGESEARLLLARAIQLFMPGKPQIWYLDLFAGKNDVEAVRGAGPAGHKEINRTNLDWARIEEGLKQRVTLDQLALIRFRNTCPAFKGDPAFHAESSGQNLYMAWESNGCTATLTAELSSCHFTVAAESVDGKRTLRF